ncbi:hypothetical protein [Clavibacter lycopersici]|nr:hypothetical protein [Clavibacter lycopersici]
MQTCTNTTTVSSRRRPTLLLGFALAGSLVVAAGPSPAAHAATTPAATSSESAPAALDDDPRSQDLRGALELIESVPDEVLAQGDAATAEWFRENGVGSGAGTKDGSGLVTTQASVLGCTAAIATVIASTAFPAAKILKVKKLIGELGGVAKAVQIFWGASFSYEKLQVVGGAALALAGELIGITSVKEECFS